MTETGSVFPEHPGLEPRWERRCPDRFRFEIEALRHAGVTPVPDPAALQVGRLAITFDWPLDADTILTLKAVYPDTFPRIRPQVFLVAGLEPWPGQHINPRAGNLCLLGRESRQWMSKWTLRKLLDEQLEDAVRGGGVEDPQGEPAEVWWNTAGPPGACCLIDSAWNPENVRQGTLQLCYAVGEVKKLVPIVRAVVTEVCDEDGTVLFKWEGPLPPDVAAAKRSLSIRWVGLDGPFLPTRDIPKQIDDLQQTHPWLQHIKSHSVGSGLKIQLFAVVHPSEVGFHHTGVGWVFFQLSGKVRAFDGTRGKRGRSPLRVTTLPVYRAGPEDIGHRVPAVALLRQKRILVVGAGAIGAPVALELARNGCGVLHLLEYDVVEPGNTVRWPLGASAWGRSKLEALSGFLRREYPATKVELHPHCLGQAGQSDAEGDDDVLDPVLREVDLVIDGSASHGVTWVLGDRCREVAVPLISVSATPSLQGGVVVRHSGGGGCPICLEHAWNRRELMPPPGRDSEDSLTQPPGCAERTFVGAGYDLQELSLQAVRLAVETLSSEAPGDSRVQILSFVDKDGQPCPPRWQVDPLPVHPNCGCRA